VSLLGRIAYTELKDAAYCYRCSVVCVCVFVCFWTQQWTARKRMNRSKCRLGCEFGCDQGTQTPKKGAILGDMCEVRSRSASGTPSLKLIAKTLRYQVASFPAWNYQLAYRTVSSISSDGDCCSSVSTSVSEANRKVNKHAYCSKCMYYRRRTKAVHLHLQWINCKLNSVNWMIDFRQVYWQLW